MPWRCCWSSVWRTCWYSCYPCRGSHRANVETWHCREFGEYAHQVLLSSSHTSSVSFVVYHVSISFGTVIKMTPWRRQHWWNEERGAKACGEHRSHTTKLADFPTCRRKQWWTIHRPICYAGAVRPKWGKGAGSQWWWSSPLPSETSRWKLSDSMRSWGGGPSHHAACHTYCYAWPQSDSSSNRRYRRRRLGNEASPGTTICG